MRSPEKENSIRFSDAQLKVIETRGKNILVSAAAGSGKTAVLVERIIRRILSDEDPVDIDRLLVVTFTNAAATSMRQKIRDALEARYEAEPENENVLRQRTLINMAHITTIHSFCLSVIRDNFNRTDLDASFRIGDEGELALMKEEALEKVMNEAYEGASEDFTDFLASYSLKRDDSDVKQAVSALYEFSRGKSEPEKWLGSLAADYDTDTDNIEDTGWYGELMAALKAGLNVCLGYLEEAERICGCPAGPYFYADTVNREREDLKRIAELPGYEQIRDALETFGFGRLSSKKDGSVDTGLKDEVKSCRETVKKEIGRIKKKFCLHPWSLEKENLKRTGRAAAQLSKLCLEFTAEFEKAKREKDILDFSDLEHYALKIMRSGAAEEYRAYFEEIMTDEYQDSNPVQEELLTMIARENNYFCVGDVKQSIYRFRLADPSIFMARYDSYSADKNSVRIDLKQNFRSRKSVLDAVNAIFEPVMSRGLGGVDYDENHRLNAGADYEDYGEDTVCEMVLVEGDPQGDLEKPETEAYFAAQKIRELVGSYTVSGKDGARPCEYRDIVILMRAVAGRAEVFEKILSGMGIPVFISSTTGYFQNDVIRKIVDLISVIDNPRQDIPLAAVLKSPFGGFGDRELAELRAFHQEGMLIDAMEAKAGQAAGSEDGLSGNASVEQADGSSESECAEPGDLLSRKCRTMLCKLSSYREMSSYLPIHDLIDRIIRDHDYETYACIKGGSSPDNLRLLLKKAADFEATSYHGLFHFVRYIEKLKKYETDTGSAVMSNDGNCVNIMSIHKSKGLEFPIVLLTGCEKKFNMQDSRSKMIMDDRLGVGLDHVDPEKHLKSATILKNLISEKLINESKGEEMRVLYVAMTRAKEKLIMSGVFADIEKAGNKRVVSPYTADSYYDLIRYGLDKSADPDSVRVKTVSFGELVGLTTEETAERQGNTAVQKALSSDVSTKELKTRIFFTDDHELVNRIPSKVAVTKLKERFEPEDGGRTGAITTEEEEKVTAGGRTQGGARRGTAYHKAFELADRDKIRSVSDAETYLESLVTNGQLSAEDAETVRAEDIFNFAAGKLAERMQRAGEKGGLFREQPFIFETSASEVDISYPEGEKVLIQGIIDAFFIEDGEIVIVDYKTDRVRDKDILKERYTGQLELYAKALSQITGMKVREKLIYSVALDREIKL